MWELKRNAYPDGNERPSYGIWLILLLINIAWGSFRTMQTLLAYFNSLDNFTLIYFLLMVVVGICAAIFFFMRHPYTPALFIAFLSINLAYFVIGSLFIWQYDKGAIDYFGLIRIVIICLLAIPYLLVSDRVKEVFAKR
jgi:hypothetical protein